MALVRDAHATPVDEVLRTAGVDVRQGLDLGEVARRQAEFGPNEIARGRVHGPLRLLADQLRAPLIYILIAAAVVTGLLDHIVDAVVIAAVVVVNVTVGFVQEARALQAVNALQRTLASSAIVVREGRRTDVPASELVPGDIVVLQPGDRVPADLRLVAARELRIDESMLTGESEPVSKHADTVVADTPLADRRNMTFSTTLVSAGAATGVVVGIGRDTEIGRIQHLIATADVLATPLSRRIERFSRMLVVAILVLAALTFGIGLMHGQPFVDMFFAAVALAVGAIPEGLPAVITVTLAIGVTRMASRQAIIRSLPAVETLGSTPIICSDKTGTLTQNEMTVQSIYTAGRRVAVSGAGYDADGAVEVDGEPGTALRECLLAGLLCNDSSIEQAPDGRFTVHGDPTEAALIVAARKAGLDSPEVVARHDRIDVIPFESAFQYMATLHEAGEGRTVYFKGSPEATLRRCRETLDDAGNLVPLDPDAVLRVIEEMASEGLRVLAFARRQFPVTQDAIDHPDLEEGLVFLGVQGMMDPPRPEARAAVRQCQRAGIQVKMITGDHATTAAAIARMVGIAAPDGGAPAILTGREIDSLPVEDLPGRALATGVFARVSPEHKLRLVQALQARGHVVAMTGDGVNDAPALRQADIGVAMALGGTEVAREASDMVLTDDNFASIAAAVEEGRGTYDNLQKFISWTLPTNGGEAGVILLAVILGQALPILPVQILWVNMATAVFLGLTLALEPRERDLMERPPRDPASGIVSKVVVQRMVFVSGLLTVAVFATAHLHVSFGASLEQARTAAVGTLVVAETFHLLNCRSLTHSPWYVGWFSNRWIWLGITAMLTLQVAFTYLPVMNDLFHTAPLGLWSWLAMFGLGLVVFVLVAMEKGLRLRAEERGRPPTPALSGG